ncbi:uncharacterized protein K02A2.6-like [Xenia sp. Carnegie-2017]|uniref:uncharacterized protein K02A2.6-like n=1 Tax=Xenia sp. Carnegie-2017 TaxID=2897299 RepID=UPI001F03FC57|nr:uncharacterized protein K02A2.6-like [Xenia sp. Carnegie-2017]
MGHKITSDGLQSDPEKVKAILNMPIPKDKKDLQRFLGMVQYLAKFIPYLSEMASLLRDMLKKENDWCWLDQHQIVYDRIKKSCGENPIYGRDVNVETDHKPLEQIFKKPLHQSPLRLQKMLLKLQKYSLKVSYKKGAELYLADQLSRAYIQEESDDHLEDFEINVVLPVSEEKMNQLKEETKKDKVMKMLRQYVENGWPDLRSKVDLDVLNYWDFKETLSVQDDLLFKGDRAIIPESLRTDMLKAIHQGHFGSESCKRRARECLYWPKMSLEIEAEEPLQSHTVPHRPWSKVGADLFELNGRSYLLMVDYYSGFFEIDYLLNTTSKTVITKMKSQIARYGIFEDLITDNGPQFRSKEFRAFSSQYGFKHTTSSPGYPKSNGMSERAVQTAKAIIKKAKYDNTDPYLGLLNYRNTPRNEIVGSPAQRLMGRRTRTLLPI